MADVALMTVSIVLWTNGGSSGGAVIRNQLAYFSIGVAASYLLGLLVDTWLVSCFQLEKPERV